MDKEIYPIKFENNKSNLNYIINFKLYKSFLIINYLDNKRILNHIVDVIQNSKNENQNNKFSDKIKLLKYITNNNELEYKGIKNCLENDPDSQECIYHLISTKEVIGKKRILIGSKGDGCYVLLNDFENIKFAYSFGIGKRIQFDHELAKRGIDVYMYDHTIESLPFQNTKFHWKKIGITGNNIKKSNLKTIEELILENGHTLEKNMILKMDVEFWEWESIIDLKEETLNQFKYIAIEYHFIDEKKINKTQIYYKVMKKISKTHQAFYVRCNGDRSWKINFGNNRICHIMEVSYIIKKGNIFTKDESIYPMYEFDYIKPKEGKLEMNLNLLKLFD